MKLTLLTPAFLAILGLALASAPLPTHAQTSTTMASTAPTEAPATTTTTSTAPTTSTKPKKPSTPHTIGLLTAIAPDGSSISVQNKKDGTRMFNISSTLKILKDSKPATLADFAVGDKVYVAYTTDASGTLTATTLSKKTPKVKPATTAAPASTTTPSAPTTTTTSTP